MKRRMFSFILLLSMVLGMMPELSANSAADNSGYAECIFGDSDTRVNVESIELYNRTLVEKAGKKAIQRTPGTDDLYISMKLNDSFTNPEGQPVIISVEYFDEGHGSFTIAYSGTNNQYGNGRHSNAEDIVYQQDTGEWKTFDFYIDDITFDHSYYGGYDFRIGLWADNMGFSDENVYIHSIKVQKVPAKKLLWGEMVSEYQGNIFGPGENKLISMDVKNRADSELVGTVDYTVKNFDGNVMLKKSKDITVARTDTAVTFDLNEIDRFGVYTLEAEYNLTGITDGEEQTFVFGQKCDFSYVNKVPNDIKNEKVNVQTHGTWYGTTAAATAADWLGVGSVRDEIRWRYVEQEKGKLSIPADNQEYINALRGKNVDFLLELAFGNWLYDGTTPDVQMIAPETEEQLNGWERYCGFVAETYKDYIKNFEVWNEYNISPFNLQNASPENYVEMTKRAKRAVLEHIPDANIIGGGLAQVDVDYLKRILEAGIYDYVDGFSCHPYDWSGEFRNQMFIDDMKAFRAAIDAYGGNKLIYMTELGINDGTEVDTGVSTIEKAAMVIQAYSLMVGENLADRWWWYDLIKSSADTTDQETNFGLIKTGYNVDGETAYAATPAYAVMSGMNYMLTDAEVAGSVVYEDSEMRAYRFHSRFGDDIATAWSTTGDRNINLDLGCDEVEIYDMYSNLIGTAQSSTGEYTFTVGNSPIYIRGDFTKFLRADGETLIDSNFENCSEGSQITTDSGVDGWYLKRQDPSADVGTASIINDDGNKRIKMTGDGVRVEKAAGKTYTSGTVSFTYKIKSEGLGIAYAFIKGDSEWCAPSLHGSTAKLGKYPPWNEEYCSPAVYADKTTPMTLQPDVWYTITGTIDLDNDKIAMIIQDPQTTARVVKDTYYDSFKSLQFCNGWDGYDMYVDDVVIQYYGSSKTQITAKVGLPFTETFESYTNPGDMQHNWNVYSAGGSSINTEQPKIVTENGNKVFYLGFSKGPDNTCAKALFTGKVTNGIVNVELDIKPSDKMATHLYLNGTRKGGEPGVSAMSMCYFNNGIIRAMSSGDGSGIELGRYSADTWYHCTVAVDIAAGTMAVTVEDGNGNQYEASGIYSEIRGSEMLSIEGITLQEWGASQSGGSYFDNISVTQSRPLAALPFIDDFDAYENPAEMVAYGWNVYPGYSNSRPGPNIDSEIRMDPEGGKAFWMGLNNATDSAYAAQDFAEPVTGGGVVAEFDIQPSASLSTHVFFTQGTSFATMLYFSGGKIAVGKTTDEAGRVIGQYDPGEWYHCKAVMDIDRDVVSAVVTDGNGKTMASGSLTIRDGMEYSYVDGFTLQEWGASENAGSCFDNIVIRKTAKKPSITLRDISFVNGDETTTSRLTAPPETEKILLDFKTEMDVGSLSGIRILDPAGDMVPYTALAEESKAVLELHELLKPNTSYTIEIPASVANSDGIIIGSAIAIPIKTTNGRFTGNVASLKIGDEDVVQLSQIKDGDILEATAEIVNSTNEAKQAVLLFAVYGEDGALKEVSSEKISAAANLRAEYKLRHTAGNMDGAAEIKVMLWEGFETISPIGGSLIIGE